MSDLRTAPPKPFLGLTVERRYRFLYKPLVFLACLIPLAWMTCALFGWFGFSAGVDQVKFLELRCGKTALNMILLTLMITPVRQLARLPNLVRLRRMLGLFAFFYVLLHFAVYLLLDVDLDWHMVASDILKRPYITLGFTAMLLLIPLAVTSTNRMMRRLGRRWGRLHRLTYVIAILGVWHFYWQEKIDVREPLVYAGVLLVLFGYRWIRSPKMWAALAPLRSAGGVPAPAAPAVRPERARPLVNTPQPRVAEPSRATRGGARAPVIEQTLGCSGSEH
jgi:sulfoxide reductase heme-binding subunit YedZ